MGTSVLVLDVSISSTHSECDKRLSTFFAWVLISDLIGDRAAGLPKPSWNRRCHSSPSGISAISFAKL